MLRRKKLIVHVHDCMPLILAGVKVFRQEIISLRSRGDETGNINKRKQDVPNKNLSAYELVIQRKVAQKRKLLKFLKMAEAKASNCEKIGDIKRKDKQVKGKFKSKWTQRIADTSNIDYSKKSKKDEDSSTSSDSSESETSFLKIIRHIKRQIKPERKKLKTRQAHTDKGNLRKSRKKSNVNDSKKKEDEDNSS